MQDNKELAFLYTVNPRKVITGLSGVNAIRTAKSLFLTKEDVKICLQKATVYRRFASEGINERVTVGNIDRLHRENYVSEKDWVTDERENRNDTSAQGWAISKNFAKRIIELYEDDDNDEYDDEYDD